MTTAKPMAVFATDEELLHAVAQAKASLALSGSEVTPDEEAMLIKAFRERISHDEYMRWVEDAVFWGKKR